MSIAVKAIPSIVSAQGVAGDVAFEPGSVVSARVLQVSPDNQVRISIGGQSIDVQTQIPLQPGQTLQLAVSQTSDGIRLAVLPQQAGGGGAASNSVTLAPDLGADLVTTLAASKLQLTSLEAMAVSTAAQTAVTRQASLSALFANLGAAASLADLPPKLQQAIADVLAQRPSLDAQLTGGDVKSAFQNSGLFLEAALAKGAPIASGMPDMKAALIVLKQTLATALDGDASSVTAPATNGQSAAMPASASLSAMIAVNPQMQAMAATLVPSLPKVPEKDDLAHLAGSLIGEETTDLDPASLATVSTRGSTGNAPVAIAQGGAQRFLEALQTAPKGGAGAAALIFDDALMSDLLPPMKGQAASAEAIARVNIPPPPVRGGLPTAQPMVQPTLLPNAPIARTVQHLMSDTDAALARQTLHQIASLPDRIEAVGAQRLDQPAPRWSFEIPFAMPQGTAVAQFEISRDGGQGSEAEAATRVWRARFSLDVEPAGPVHALVSLTGDKTSVRMWAERPATALQLQAGTAQLSQALIRANLQPGDIVVREGAPLQRPPAAAGHFLDRAL